MNHRWFRCGDNCTKMSCEFCDGGLSWCMVCDKGEGDLAPECPGPPPIDRFAHEFRWLSNFWEVSVLFDGVKYRTVEHAYQAAKVDVERPDYLEQREKIRLATTAGQAKRLGNAVRMRIDWEVVKDRVMLDLLQQKFVVPDLRSALLNTGDVALIEGNNWHDTYWGVCDGTCRRPHPLARGFNHLGKMLMGIRTNIRTGHL